MALPAPAPHTTVVVTGSSSGIGTEIARELARRGYDLTLVARREDRLHELSAELERDHGIRADVRPCDLADPTARRALVDELRGDGGSRVIGVVNNAGAGQLGRFVDHSLDEELVNVRLNVESVVELTGAFLPDLIERGAGAILNVASTAAFQPLPGFGVYAASKAFVQSFSEATHAELGGTGVTVTTLCPGPVHTEFGEKAGGAEVEHRSPEMLWMEPAAVAAQAVAGMAEGRRSVVPGWQNKVSATAGRFAPRSLLLPLVRRFS